MSEQKIEITEADLSPERIKVRIPELLESGLSDNPERTVITKEELAEDIGRVAIEPEPEAKRIVIEEEGL